MTIDFPQEGIKEMIMDAIDQTLYHIASPYLPDWNGREVYLAYSGAALGLGITLLVAQKTASFIFGGQETRFRQEPACLSVLGYDVFCINKNCYETSCGLLSWMWNGCPASYCTPFN
jgi:hypothetical protein